MDGNKKAVFLFGAGAVLDWGAPKTLCDGASYTIIPEHRTGKISDRPCCLTHITEKGAISKSYNVTGINSTFAQFLNTQSNQ